MSADLDYEVSGDRLSPAVLFLHGFMGSSADRREVMRAMGDRFCIAVDLPGHGASLGTSQDNYTLEGATRAGGELESLAVPAFAIAGELDDKYAGISSRMSRPRQYTSLCLRVLWMD